MKEICVVTGGGSGIGLETARILGERYFIVLAGRTVEKLESAAQELRNQGIEVAFFPCDVSDRLSVQRLVHFAVEKGNVRIVVSAAGRSPRQDDAETVFAVDAMGTIYVNDEFSPVMEAGACILDVSSMSAYMVPEARLPVSDYAISLEDSETFREKMLELLRAIPPEQAAGMAYVIAKHFVIWYAKQCALAYGKKGIRVLSISPGSIATSMGELEKDSSAPLVKRGALGRMGEPVEIARIMAFVASPDASYLTGTDILCDGGTMAAF